MQTDATAAVLLLDKPLHLSSQAAVTAVRKHYGADKAGHTGSLDPLATGLLPICLGQATKFAQFWLAEDKHYDVGVTLGVTTTTGDTEGAVTAMRPWQHITQSALTEALDRLRGPIAQIPPMYSALKHQGRPLYALARRGETIARPPRPVTIHALDCLDWQGACLQLRVHCSKGTYIRVLAEDLGQLLGCGAHVHALRRTGVGTWTLAQAVSLTALQASSAAEARHYLQPADVLVAHWPILAVDSPTAWRLAQGQALPHAGRPGWWRVYQAEIFCGLAEITATGVLTPRRWMTLPTAVAAVE